MIVVLRLCQEISLPSALSLPTHFIFISRTHLSRCVGDGSRSNPLSDRHSLNLLKIYFEGAPLAAFLVSNVARLHMWWPDVTFLSWTEHLSGMKKFTDTCALVELPHYMVYPLVA